MALTEISLAEVYFVDAGISTPGSGTGSWSNAVRHLRDALALATTDGDVIRIKGATGSGLVYYPDQYWNGTATVDTNLATDSFVIDGAEIDGDIIVEGQYTGASTTARDPAYRTILSGAIDEEERSLHVLRIDGVSEDTEIDGLEIADGAADASGIDIYGGGILLGATDRASPLLRACVIRDNYAFRGGGAFFGDGSPTVRGVAFTGNTAENSGGGGLWVQPTLSDPPSDLLLLSVRFEGNRAEAALDARAGGAWIWEPTRRVDIINNVVETESGFSGGGGGLVIRFAPECASLECGVGEVSCEPCAPPCDPEDVTYANVINTLFVGNDSRGGSGGGVKVSRPTSFINCTIAGNLSNDVVEGGAGVWLAHGTCAEFLNTIVHGNLVSGSSLSAFQRQIRQSGPDGGDPGPIIMKRSDVEGVCAESYECCASPPMTSTCNIDADPKFVDAAGGNYRLSAGSPCRNFGIDAHMPDDLNDVDEDSDFDEPTPDLDFWTRIYGTSVDIGAYEFRCLADLDCDCDVDGFDEATLLGQWSGSSTYSPCPPYRSGDLNSDCKVDGGDLARLLSGWGSCATGCVAETSGCPTGGGGGESLGSGGSGGGVPPPTLAEMVEYFMENGHEDLVALLIATWPEE